MIQSIVGCNMVCGSKVKPTSKTDPIGTLQLCLAHNLVKSLIYFVIMALTRLCTSLLFSAKVSYYKITSSICHTSMHPFEFIILKTLL